MEQTEKKTLSGHLSDFIVKFRLVILITLGVLILATVATGVFLSVTSMQTKSGLAKLDVLELRFDKLDAEEESFDQAQSDILNEAKALAQSTSGVVRGRSYMFAANIDFELENWADARESFVQAAEANSDAYTAPICLYNAAICSEELKEYDIAIEYLQSAMVYENFAVTARALFTIGRIEEEFRGNYQAAADAYKSLNAEFSDSEWANLSKSRLIALEAELKIQ